MGRAMPAETYLRVGLAVAVDGDILAVLGAAQRQKALRVPLLEHAHIRFRFTEVPHHDLHGVASALLKSYERNCADAASVLRVERWDRGTNHNPTMA